jgi:hypothetical protein
MRYALIAAVVIAAGAAALFAVAQPAPPSTATAPDRKLMPIAWSAVQAALRDKRLQRATLSQISIAAGAPRPSLPLLLPFDEQIAAAALVTVFPQPYSYAATMRLDNLTVDVHGDRRATILEDNDPLLRAMQSNAVARLAGADVPYTLGRTEGGYDLTFNRFGAAYLISIECFNPETDQRCTKPDHILSLGEKMGLVGKDPH